MDEPRIVGKEDALSRELRYAAYTRDGRALREYNYRKDDRTDREFAMLEEYLARNTCSS